MLCGIVHPGLIHGYVKRNYRSRESQENIRIIIPVIICSLARDQGKQYTKRLLPEFLIPRSVIRLDHLLEVAKLPPQQRAAERVCELLGCIDPRTAGKQLSALGEAINRVTLELSHRRASSPELGDLPPSYPDTSALDYVYTLFAAEQAALERAGSAAAPRATLASFLQAAMWKLPQKKPSSYVSAPGCPP